MRIVPVRDELTTFLERRLSNSMNAEEAVAKGTALFCAILSPLFKVRDYKLVDILNYSIKLTLRYPEAAEQNYELFPASNAVGSSPLLTSISTSQARSRRSR